MALGGGGQGLLGSLLGLTGQSQGNGLGQSSASSTYNGLQALSSLSYVNVGYNPGYYVSTSTQTLNMWTSVTQETLDEPQVKQVKRILALLESSDEDRATIAASLAEHAGIEPAQARAVLECLRMLLVLNELQDKLER